MAVDYQRNHRKIYQNTFRFAKLQFYKSTEKCTLQIWVYLSSKFKLTVLKTENIK